jgi:polyisoprenoid-binding protein YceI
MFNLDSQGIESMLKKTLAALAIGTALLSAGQVMAADYKIDKEGQHAFIDWKISHLGYSYIHGTFKDWTSPSSLTPSSYPPRLNPPVRKLLT